MLDLKQDDGGVTIRVRVQPKASKNETAGFLDGALKVRLTAPPVDGAANKACIEFLSRLFGVAKSRVAIVQGHTGRNKTIRIEGLSAAEVRDKLGG
ncbi:YggU family protein [Desulfallas sp. Bu1-1]|jgi:hypothetical protein|uniref:DUF167 domain-containing protein n=1 Tax=Desulfallas sp. Bu1-1 TaxID=2787620 RepID=UPI0018A04673|nr:DUF167 domain-containing protein [Desulfallas sp. Bu1-1]MBF7083178.1 YggU family protein [Desulfallas sp. Bu1-1]